MEQKIVIIDYEAGNIQSVKNALNSLGYSAVLSSDIKEIQTADKVIFPGVGEASWAMKKLREKKLDVLIPQLQQPVLGICLGMQLMCVSSEESETKGLGIFPVAVKKFVGKEKIPHVGWNSIFVSPNHLLRGLQNKDYCYFVHSYYVPMNSDSIASCYYMQDFSACMQKENFYACQFHPEKSGVVGSRILKNFIDL